MNRIDYKITVIGIGGVGGYLASLLTRRYPNVTLMDIKDKKELLQNNGLKVFSDIHGDFVVHPYSIVDNSDNMMVQDFIFICVKRYSLEEVLASIQNIVGDHTVIVPIMDGLDHGHVTRKMLSKGHVIDSVIYITSSISQNEVYQVGPYATINLGNMPEYPVSQDIIDHTIHIFQNANIDCRQIEDDNKELWHKFILNCAFGTLTAFYHASTGDLKRNTRYCIEFASLLQEAYDVAKAKGINVVDNLVQIQLNHFLRNQHNDATSALRRDIDAKQQSELEVINGYLVHEADRLHVDIPKSKYYYEGLKHRCEKLES